MTTRTSPRISMSFHHDEAVITLDGVAYGTPAKNAQNLVEAADVVRATRMQAEWARSEGNQAEADRLVLWETEFMERMSRYGADKFITALIEDRS